MRNLLMNLPDRFLAEEDRRRQRIGALQTRDDIRAAAAQSHLSLKNRASAGVSSVRLIMKLPAGPQGCPE